MDKLIYKTFIFPNNPHTYRELCSREAVYGKNEAGEDVFRDMGPAKRTITGSGVFFGENAYESFRKLAELFQEDSPGNLQHPNWGIRYCYLTELELTQEPRENCVAYRFEFRQADSNGIVPK